jgi:hypothetical protein
VLARSEPSGDQATVDTGPLTPDRNQVGERTGPLGVEVEGSEPGGTDEPQAVPAGSNGRSVGGDRSAFADDDGLGGPAGLDVADEGGPGVLLGSATPHPATNAVITATTSQRHRSGNGPVTLAPAPWVMVRPSSIP